MRSNVIVLLILCIYCSITCIAFYRAPLCTRTKPQPQNLLSIQPNKDASNNEFNIKAWFNPGTRGGIIVWAGLLTLIPIGFYNFLVNKGLESSAVGAFVGAVFVLLTNMLWASTYVFRVANKDMTYAKQLRDYENAVLQKRLDELGEKEVQVLLEEIEQDQNKK